MECPYPFQAYQIHVLDYKTVYPVVQWIVRCKLAMHTEMGDEVSFLLHKIEEEENNLQQLKELFIDGENSVKRLHINLKEQALERNESDRRSCCKHIHSNMQAETSEMENKLFNGIKSKTVTVDLNHSINELLERLNSAKTELAATLRANLMLKRQLDDIPSQAELLQYEHRFSELYVQIQEKLCQTRKYYATYNALLETKELMLKETSLLNSISAQFQDAMNSTTGRAKLIDSMEGIVKGTQQKLEKVQLGLLREQKICDSLKEKHAAAISEQRQRSSLLKAFQEECARSEKLQSLIAI